MAVTYKVTAPCFFGGVFRTPDNKHNRVVLKTPFKDGECPSYLEPVDGKPVQNEQPEGDGLDDMNKDELLIVANQEHDLDLNNRNKKDEIIAAIRKVREEASQPPSVDEMDRGQLVAIAEGLEIEFSDETSDEDLAAKIKEVQG